MAWLGIGLQCHHSPTDLGLRCDPQRFGGGIWQSGGGLAADASGNFYFTTSNGTFDLNTSGPDAGDTIEKLSSTGTLVDYFTPHDQANMETNNIELVPPVRSCSSIRLPDPSALTGNRR